MWASASQRVPCSVHKPSEYRKTAQEGMPKGYNCRVSVGYGAGQAPCWALNPNLWDRRGQWSWFPSYNAQLVPWVPDRNLFLWIVWLIQ